MSAALLSCAGLTAEQWTISKVMVLIALFSFIRFDNIAFAPDSYAGCSSAKGQQFPESRQYGRVDFPHRREEQGNENDDHPCQGKAVGGYELGREAL